MIKHPNPGCSCDECDCECDDKHCPVHVRVTLQDWNDACALLRQARAFAQSIADTSPYFEDEEHAKKLVHAIDERLKCVSRP